MNSDNENSYFSYQRGKVKFTGRNDKDRKSLRLDIILYWSWKILIALGILVSMFRMK